MALRFGFILLTVVIVARETTAENYASDERSSAALGHFARARTMLVEALAEFEAGRKIASPDMLLDSEEWRISVISRTEELNRVLDPKPRVTRSGVRFRASKHLIRRERDRLPPVVDGAQDSNTAGEEQREAELELGRRASGAMSEELEAPLAEESKKSSDSPDPAQASRDQEIRQLLESVGEPSIGEISAPDSGPAAAAGDATAKSPAAANGETEDELSAAIEQAIQSRLEKVKQQSPESDGAKTESNDGVR